MHEHFFTTYVRTKLLFKRRLKDLDDYDTVRIYAYELKKLGVNNGPLLYSLRERKQIWYDDKGNFKVVHEDGPVDPSLIDRGRKRVRVPVMLTDLHLYMMRQLMFVSLHVPVSDMPVYFKAFLDLRHEQLSSFFSVDGFSGRVHTPVVNLKGCLRKFLKLCGRTIVSLDVKQMQPTILAKVLLESVGVNPFSTAIFDGEDVYLLLQEKGSLDTRQDAKKMLFQLIFGKPMDGIGKMFKGDTSWVDWINSYKARTEHQNPHKQDKHTNLAWLLQFSEVKVMTCIWNKLRFREIPFLSIHDDILCRDVDKDEVFKIMDCELRLHFPKFCIVIDH